MKRIDNAMDMVKVGICPNCKKEKSLYPIFIGKHKTIGFCSFGCFEKFLRS